MLPSTRQGMITMPTGFDQDAAERYRQAKFAKYARYLEALRLQGIQYLPMIWTAWGRAHPAAVQVLKSLATRAARRRGLTSGSDILRAAKLQIALEIQARNARMVHACLHQGALGDEEDDVEVAM